MILNRPLNKEERAESQKTYYFFNLLNGMSYMCLGEALVVLFAISLGCPDYLVALIGAQQYFGFILLPLGKAATARWGAAKSQAMFWVTRNGASLFVASAIVASLFFPLWVVSSIIMIGAFLFYGFRAAGVVMSGPLIGEICSEDERQKVLGNANMCFYVACLVMIFAIILVLRLKPGSWTLAGIIVVGSLMGLNASRFLAKIDESASLQLSARKKMMPEIRAAMHNKMLLRYLLASFAANTVILMILSASMLMIKRGCGISDTNALLFSSCQFAGSALFSYICAGIAGKFGPRKVLIGDYVAALAVPVIWIITPSNGPIMILCAATAFTLLGASSISMSNSQVHYFLQSVEPENRVVGSMLSAMIMSVLAGIAGMIISGFLLKHLISGNSLTAAFEYKTYFFFVFLIAIPGVILQLRLFPLPIERRKHIVSRIPREKHF